MQRFLRLGEKLSEIRISGTDIGEYNIVVHTAGGLKGVGVMPAPVEKASRVMQQYIARISDVTLPVIFDNYPAHPKKEIAIGGVNREYDETNGQIFAPDEYRIKVKDGNVTINGGTRGVLYGVYVFLEKYLGVRFFTRACERIDYKPVFEIEETDESFSPVFEYRDYCHWNMFDPEFTVKCKINGSFARHLREEDGYGVGFAGGFGGLVHTFSLFCSPQKYFEEHPEYYAVNEEGKHVPYALCHTNEGTQEVVAQNMIECLDEEPAPTLISLSINDGVPSRCNCAKCKGLFGGKGNDTDRLLYFVNRVARRIAKKYPDVKVDTISYADMSAAPQCEKPDKNVVVRVCGDGLRGFTLEEAKAAEGEEAKRLEKRRVFADRIDALSAMTDKIYVWDYPYDYNAINSIFPVLHTLRQDMRYFADHSVKGVFINGQTDTCDFEDLKIYLLSKVMFDPYMGAEEYERHLTEFLEGFYGEGWTYLYDYIKKCEEIGKKTYFDTHSEPRDVIPLNKKADGEYDYSFIDESREAFKKALGKTRSAGERRRVEKNALQTDYYELFSVMPERLRVADEAEKNVWREKNRKLYESFIKFGVTRIVENTFLPVLKNYDQSPALWGYWDGKSVTGDKINEATPREMYLLLPLPDDVKESADISFLYQTNNENERGYVTIYGSEDEGINATWSEYGDFKEMTFRGAKPLTKKEFSEISGIALDDVRINLLPIHLRGAILKVESMDASAFAFVRDLKVLKKQ